MWFSMCISLREYLITLYLRNIALGIEESEYNNYKYVYNADADELVITEYISNDERVVIDGAFDSIGSCCFSYDELKEVVLHKNIKNIYEACFLSSGLEKINLENVRHIGNSAFALTNLDGDLDLRCCETLGSDAFLYTNVKNIKFGNFIHICKTAFSGAYDLTDVYFKNVYFEERALAESKIKKVVIENSCLMENNACAMATELEIFEAKELESLSKQCFYLDFNLKRIYCPKLKYLGDNYEIERFIVY